MKDWTKKRNSEIYANCMNEIKTRISISQESPTSYLQGWFYLEFRYLQVRKICELFAFSRMITNRIIFEESNYNFKSEWNCEKILNITNNYIEKYKEPYLTPSPIKNFQKNQTGKLEIKGFGNEENKFLKISEIIKIYKKSCDYVHARNHYQNLEKFYPNTQGQFNSHLRKLNNWIQKFGDLLNSHVVGFRMKKSHVLWIVQLSLSEPKKKVIIAEAKSISK